MHVLPMVRSKDTLVHTAAEIESVVPWVSGHPSVLSQAMTYGVQVQAMTMLA